MAFNPAELRAGKGSPTGGQFTASGNAQQGIDTKPVGPQGGRQTHAVYWNKQRAGTVIQQSRGSFSAVHGDMRSPNKVTAGHPSIASAAAAIATTHISAKPMSQAQIELQRLQYEAKGMTNPADKQLYANMISQLKQAIANKVAPGPKVPKVIHSKPAPKPKKAKATSRAPRSSGGSSRRSSHLRSSASHAPRSSHASRRGSKGSKGGGSSGSSFNAKHPRAAKGQPGAGEFITSGSSTSGNSLNAQAAAGVQRKLGNLDPNTIKDYQEENNLVVDGIVGKQTAEALLGNKNANGVAVGGLTTQQKQKLAKL